MIDETLRKYPYRFLPMVARIGQIAGSQSTGDWNPAENIPFLLKSCQTSRKLPDLEGARISYLFSDDLQTYGRVLDSILVPCRECRRNFGRITALNQEVIRYLPCREPITATLATNDFSLRR